MIWLRYVKRIPTLADGIIDAIGVEDGVIEREALGNLIELDAGFTTLSKERKAWSKELKTLRQQAQEEAKAIFEQAQQQGYMQGQEQAVQEWQHHTIEMLSNARRIQSRMHVRLSELVASAVEHIVRITDRRALFERAINTLEHISEGASLLNVRVHPDEVDAAQEAFDAFSKEWSARGQAIKVVVHADAQLPLGSCICETEFGMIDASLEVQLQAMRSALGRAIEQGQDEVVENLLAQAQAEVDAQASEAMFLDAGEAPQAHSTPSKRQPRRRRSAEASGKVSGKAKTLRVEEHPLEASTVDPLPKKARSKRSKKDQAPLSVEASMPDPAKRKRKSARTALPDEKIAS